MSKCTWSSTPPASHGFLFQPLSAQHLQQLLPDPAGELAHPFVGQAAEGAVWGEIGPGCRTLCGYGKADFGIGGAANAFFFDLDFKVPKRAIHRGEVLVEKITPSPQEPMHALAQVGNVSKIFGPEIVD